jgi:hypothetical protein
MRSHAQAGQDWFPRFLVQPRDTTVAPYTYLELGSQAPVLYNNSCALELDGWRGVSLDIVDYKQAFKRERKNPFLQADATQLDWEAFYKTYYNNETMIDYLSFDIDDATEPAFDRFPWATRRFSTITIEHDQYRVGTRLRDKMRESLIAHGYDLICADVIIPGFGPFEDWFVYPDPSRVQMDRLDALRCEMVPYTDILSRMR